VVNRDRRLRADSPSCVISHPSIYQLPPTSYQLKTLSSVTGPLSFYQLLAFTYQLRSPRSEAEWDNSHKRSAKHHEALAQLPTTDYQLRSPRSGAERDHQNRAVLVTHRPFRDARQGRKMNPAAIWRVISFPLAQDQRQEDAEACSTIIVAHTAVLDGTNLNAGCMHKDFSGHTAGI
jgi:hypothetical protein